MLATEAGVFGLSQEFLQLPALRLDRILPLQLPPAIARVRTKQRREVGAFGVLDTMLCSFGRASAHRRPGRRRVCRILDALRHREAPSAAAIQTGLPRFARNDEEKAGPTARAAYMAERIATLMGRAP